MDIQSLIRLANQADLEGNYRVADKLTERAIREAALNKNVFQNMFGLKGVGPTLSALLSGGAIKSATKQSLPTDVKIKGRWFSAQDAARVNAAHAIDQEAARAGRAARPRGGAGTPPPSGPNSQSAVGGAVDQDINAGGPNAQAGVSMDGGGVEQTIGTPPAGGSRRRRTPGRPSGPRLSGNPLERYVFQFLNRFRE